MTTHPTPEALIEALNELGFGEHAQAFHDPAGTYATKPRALLGAAATALTQAAARIQVLGEAGRAALDILESYGPDDHLDDSEFISARNGLRSALTGETGT